MDSTYEDNYMDIPIKEMSDESATPLYITTAISVALVLLEQYLAHSSCSANSTSQLLLAQIRGCKAVNEGTKPPFPTPPPAAIDDKGTDV